MWTARCHEGRAERWSGKARNGGRRQLIVIPLCQDYQLKECSFHRLCKRHCLSCVLSIIMTVGLQSNVDSCSSTPRHHPAGRNDDARIPDMSPVRFSPPLLEHGSSCSAASRSSWQTATVKSGRRREFENQMLAPSIQFVR
jgi:hypothetical protein